VFGACDTVLGGDGPTRTPTPIPTATPLPATPTPEAPDLTIFRNFIYPIEGGCLPQREGLMPNAPREYRGGIHEGVDFYTFDNCVEVTSDTPVVAAKDGVVIRADLDYTALTQQQLHDFNVRVATGEDPNADAFIDIFRGGQVWIDHGSGIVTRYAHLGSIAPGITEGLRVAAGTEIGTVGDSGTPESIASPGVEIHLHFEVRTGDTFLGVGLPPDEVRALYERLFEPLD
jgi:murein DD-endopeptidase MepM/ murein hydrolase activator NlpD